MARFRVREHHRWRRSAEPAGPPDPRPSPRAHGAPSRPREEAAEPSGERLEAIHEHVRALGPVAWPAVAYDTLFGAWRHRGPSFLLTQVLLVVLTVGLFVGGVSGEAPVVYKAGPYQSATPASVIDTYVTERSVHIYPIFVNESRSGHIRAVFDSTHGDLRAPQLDEQDSVYALQVRLVRKDPTIMPVLLLSPPHESHRTVAPTADDSVSLRYPPIALDAPGKWELVVHSSKGVGHVEMHVSVAEAPIIATEGPNVAWAWTGLGLGTLGILVGAYTPGAVLLRERRDLERRQEDAAWGEQAALAPPTERPDFIRTNPRHHGVLAWERPDTDGPEGLAELPGRGWVIRVD